MRRVALLLAAALLVVAGASVTLASIPDADGVIHGCFRAPGGTLRIIDSDVTSCRAGETEINWNAAGAGPRGYYMHAQDVELPVSDPSPPPALLQLAAPGSGEGGGYLASATFELVNYGPTDAQVNCVVGIQMGHELMVPVSQLSDPSSGGLWAENVSTFTITGMTEGPDVRLACELADWVGSEFGVDRPDVTLRRGSLQAVYAPSLDNQTSE